MKCIKHLVLIFIMSFITAINAQNIPTGSSWTVTQNKDVKVHTYMSP